jgi:hypothetical protein
MELIIRPLSGKYLEDYLRFFDLMHFEKNPHWSACYCYSFHFTGQQCPG